jgi:hypothetical protein
MSGIHKHGSQVGLTKLQARHKLHSRNIMGGSKMNKSCQSHDECVYTKDMTTTTNTQTELKSHMALVQERAERQFAQMQEELEKGDGLIQVTALFTTEGEWVPARLIDNKYGTSWMVLNENGKPSGKYVPYRSAKRETQAKRGFVEGIVKVSATVVISGGFRPSAKVVPAAEIGTQQPTIIVSIDRFKDGL